MMNPLSIIFNRRNLKLALAAVMVAAVIIGYVSLVHLSFRLGSLKQERKVILKDLNLAEEEVLLLSASLEEKNRELNQLKEKIDQLSYPQRLKQALSAAQGMINTLNAELTNVKTQADILRGENFALKSRVQANTKELDRLIKELQSEKAKVATLESSQKMALQQERMTWLNDQIKEKDRHIKSLNRDIGQLKNKYSDLVKERNFLKKNIERYQKELAKKTPSGVWQKRLEELTVLLKDKEEEKNELVLRLSQLSKDKDDIAVDIDEYKRNIEQLKSINQNLQDEVLKLTANLSQKNNELYVLQQRIKEESVESIDDSNDMVELQERFKIQNERLKTVNSLYSRLKDQLKELAGILYKKDTDLEEKEKQILTLKDEITNLKITSESLQEAFKNSEDNQRQILERLSQATSLNTTLQERLNEVSILLGEDATSETRQKDSEFLTPQVYEESIPIEENTDDLRRRVEVILRSIESGDVEGEDF